MSKRSKILFFYVFLAFLLASCTREDVEIKEHEGAIEEKFSNINVSGLSVDEKLSAFLQVPDSELDESSVSRYAKNKSGDELVSGKLSVYSEFVLDQKFLEKFSVEYRTRFQKMIRAFNILLLRALSDEDWRDSAVSQELMDLYEDALLGYCDRELRGCKFLPVFSADSRSADLAVKLVRRIDQEINQNFSSGCGSDQCESEQGKNYLLLLNRYYQLVSIAHRFKGLVKNSELEFLFLKRATEYNFYFLHQIAQERGVKVKDLDPKDYLDSSGLKNLGEMFDLVIDYHAVKDPNSVEFKKFVEKFNPWTFSRRRVSPLRRGIEKMFEYASRYFVRSAEGLNPIFLQAIEKYQKEGDGSAEETFYRRVQLLNSKNRGMIQSYRLKTDELLGQNMRSLEFFVVDRFFHRHLSKEDVIQMFQATNSSDVDDFKNLTRVFIDYVKFEIIDQIHRTNEFMRELYKTNRFSNKKMFTMLLQRSQFQADRWFNLMSSVENLRDLIHGVVPISLQDFSEFDEMNAITESLKVNVKYFSVYPNMITLNYFLSKASAPFFHTFGYDRQEFDPATVMQVLMRGGWWPWFKFGNDSKKLGRGQIFLAVDYLFRSGGFNVYSFKDSGGEPAINLEKFFLRLISSAMGRVRERIDTILRGIRQLGITPEFTNFLRHCADPGGVKVQIQYKDLDRFSFLGKAEDPATDLGSAMYLYKNFQKEVALFVNQINRDVRTFRVWVKMAELHQKRLSDMGVPTDSEQLAKVQEYLNQVIEKKDYFFSRAFSYHRKVGDCLQDANHTERKVRMAQLRGEAQYFSDLYDLLAQADGMEEGQRKQFLQSEVSKRFGKLHGADKLIFPNYVLTEYGVRERLRARLDNTIKEEGKKSYHRLKFRAGFEPKYPVKIQVNSVTDISEEPYVQNVDPKDITYEKGKSKEAFIREVFQYLGVARTSWLSYFDFVLKPKQLDKPREEATVADLVGSEYGHARREKFVYDLYKLNRFKISAEHLQDIDTGKDCAAEEFQAKGECWVKISPEELLNETVLAREMSSPQSEDNDIFFYINEPEPIVGSRFVDFLLEKVSLEIQPVYRFAMKYLMDEYSEEINRTSSFKVGVFSDEGKLGAGFRSIEHLTFPPDPQFCESVFEVYNPVVESYQKRLDEFVESILSLEQQGNGMLLDRIGKISIRYKVGDSVDSTEISPVFAENNLPLIWPSDIREFKNRMRDLHLDSMSYFKDKNHMSLCRGG